MGTSKRFEMVTGERRPRARAFRASCLVGVVVLLGAGCSDDSGTGDDGLGACTTDCAGATAAAGGVSGAGVGGESGAAGMTSGPPPAGAGGVGAGGESGAGVGGDSGAAGNAGVGGEAGVSGEGGASGISAMAGMGGEGGTVAGNGGAGGSMPPAGHACTPAPTGTFQTTSGPGGPGGAYTIVRPVTLGEGGFLHPPVSWGNGLGTTPTSYVQLLENLASNGFVVIANPGTGSDAMVVRQGLEWLIAQNASGEFAGKLAVNCAGAIGYSMGGGASLGVGSHPAVKAIASIHGITGGAASAVAPILLTTSEGDDFVTISGFTMPNYNASARQPTFMAIHTRQASAPIFGDHLEPLGAGGLDAEPAIAWLRYWIYGDQAQREWFFGASCKLCGMAPWVTPMRKNHNWD